MSLRTTSPVTANPNDEHRTIARLREMVCRTKRGPSERRRIKNAQSKRKIHCIQK